MTKYIFVDDDCHIDVEITVEASNEKEAHRLAWAQLTEEQKDACGLFTCVDEIQG